MKKEPLIANYAKSCKLQPYYSLYNSDSTTYETSSLEHTDADGLIMNSIVTRSIEHSNTMYSIDSTTITENVESTDPDEAVVLLQEKSETRSMEDTEPDEIYMLDSTLQTFTLENGDGDDEERRFN